MSDTSKLQKEARRHFEAAYQSISKVVQALHSDNVADVEEAEIRIGEDALSAERVARYKILLAYGGPEYWLEGELDEHSEPETVRFYFRDWFTRPERIELSPSQAATLLEYARRFYFGE